MELPIELDSYHKKRTRNNFKFVRKDLLVNHFNVVILQVSNTMTLPHSSRSFELQVQVAGSLFPLSNYGFPSQTAFINKQEIPQNTTFHWPYLPETFPISPLSTLLIIPHLPYKSLCNHFFHVIISRLVHITHQVHQSRGGIIAFGGGTNGFVLGLQLQPALLMQLG